MNFVQLTNMQGEIVRINLDHVQTIQRFLSLDRESQSGSRLQFSQEPGDSLDVKEPPSYIFSEIRNL